MAPVTALADGRGANPTVRWGLGSQPRYDGLGRGRYAAAVGRQWAGSIHAVRTLGVVMALWVAAAVSGSAAAAPPPTTTSSETTSSETTPSETSPSETGPTPTDNPSPDDTPSETESAEPTSPEASPPDDTEPTPEEIASAPEPTDAHGVSEGDPKDRNRALIIPRVLLYPPRVALQLIAMPVRAGAFLVDRYQLPERVGTVFLMDDGKAGVVPVATAQSGLPSNGGARFYHHDIFGHGERFSARAMYGRGRAYRVRLRTGNLLPHKLQLSFTLLHQQRNRRRFFGIGNGDEGPPPDVVGNEKIDPLTSDVAVGTRYRSDSQHYELELGWNFAPRLTWSISSAVDDIHFRPEPAGPTGAENVTRYYDSAGLIGFEEGLVNTTARTQLTYDSLRRTRSWVNPSTPSTGWLVRGSLGYTAGLKSRDPSNFARWLVDVQRLFDVHRGDRVIALRFRAEGVTSPLDRIPVNLLPRLGGGNHLRGYQSYRFRDRLTAFSSVEYRYPIGEVASGYLFFDFGRVHRSLREFEFQRWRAGGGPGLILHTPSFFIARIFVAASVDGSVFFQLNLNPLTR